MIRWLLIEADDPKDVDLKYYFTFLFVANLIFPYIFLYKYLSQALHDNQIVTQRWGNVVLCMATAIQGLTVENNQMFALRKCVPLEVQAIVDFFAPSRLSVRF